METLGACNEHFFFFKIFVISVYSSAIAVGVCLSRIYLGHGICFGYLKYFYNLAVKIVISDAFPYL
jgi:hypothetical protein